ncbi:MAG TPA: ATP-binding protein [Actinomycetota bacterium]|nr:ATP-binding protein [Actinomycetota bacterium]
MRLEAKVMLWMGVLLGAAAAIALAVMARLETERIDRQWTEAGRAVAEATEDALEVSMLNNAPEDIRQSVRNVQRGALVQSVTVYRRTGVPWVTSNPDLTLAEGARTALLSSMDGGRTVTHAAASTLSVFVPVPKSPQCVGCHDEASGVLGAVEVRLDERPFQTELVKSARTSLVFAALPLLVGIVASVWAIRRSVLHPLADVGEAAERLGQGDLSVRLPAFRGWELAEVATTFNDMASKLERQHEDLRRTAEELRAELEGMEEIQLLLTSGAGLSEILGRAAGHVGSALGTDGVAIWRQGAAHPEAVWGDRPPDGDVVARTSRAGVITTSEGRLEDVPGDRAIAWAVVPASVGERCLAVVAVVWHPPRVLDPSERDLLGSLAGLVGMAVRNAELLERLQQKEQALQGLIRKTLTVQEEERRRLSRELHDETSQVLSALIMNIDLLEAQVMVDDASRSRITAVKSLAEEAARNLDRMLFELRPALLDELGLMPALRWYVAQMSDLWGIPIEFHGEKVGRLPSHVELATFRIAQEAVGNCARHARPSRVSVRVSASEDRLHLEVDDDGVGFDATEVAARARAGEAVGLEGMRERAQLAGGTFQVDSTRGRGTLVVAELPLDDAEERAVPASRREGGDRR